MTGPQGIPPTREMPSRPPVPGTPPGSGRRRWWSVVPHHLGRARTSTLVLSLLFVAILALYLSVKPETTAVGTTVGTDGTTPVPQTTDPAQPSETEEPLPTTTAPDTPDAPDETSPESPAPEDPAEEDTAPPTTSEAPAETPAPTEAPPTGPATTSEP